MCAKEDSQTGDHGSQNVNNSHYGQTSSLVQAGNISGPVYLPEQKYVDTETHFRVLLASQPPGQHEGTLVEWIKFADSLRNRNEFSDAENEYHKILRVARQTSGNYEMCLTINNKISLALEGKGDLTGAEAGFRAVLAGEVRGKWSSGARVRRRNLARVLSRQGKLAEAESEYWPLLKVCRWAAGRKGAETLRVREHLANILRRQGKLSEAESQYGALLKAYRRTLGKDHADVKIIYSHLEDIKKQRARKQLSH